MQSYENFEILIWDGLSTDKTKKVIETFLHDKRIRFYEGHDEGPGDAFNRCLRLAKGDVCSFLGSDDCLSNKSVLKNINNQFCKNEVDAVYGNLEYYGHKFSRRNWKPGKYVENSFLHGWQIPFPCFFFKKSLVISHGYLDTNFNFADDYEFIFRLVHIKQINISYLDSFFVKFRYDGRSSNFFSRLKSLHEIYKVFRKFNIKINMISFIILRYGIKIRQLI